MTKSTVLGVFAVLSSGAYTALGENLRGKVEGFAGERHVERRAAGEPGERGLETSTEVWVKNNSDKGIWLLWDMEQQPDWPDWVDQNGLDYIGPQETELIGEGTEGRGINYKYWLPWLKDIYTCDGDGKGGRDGGFYCNMDFGDDLGKRVTYCVNEFSGGLEKCADPKSLSVPKGTKIYVKNNLDEGIYFNYNMESDPNMPDWLDHYWTKYIKRKSTKEIGTTVGGEILYKYWAAWSWWRRVYDCDGQAERYHNDLCKMDLGNSSGKVVTYCVNDFSQGLTPCE